MAVTYSDHVDRAMRAAAIVLTQPPPRGAELDAVLRLHDDLTTTLAEATRLVWTGALGEPRAERERAGLPAAHEMLKVLEVHPRLAVPSASPESPAQRWSGRPTDLTADLTAHDAWKVLAAETFLARSCLDQLGPRMTTPIRADVVNHLALTSEALATASTDLARAGGLPAPETVVERSRVLAQAAAGVQRDVADASPGRPTATVPPVTATRERRKVQVVSQHADIAPALANLARLTASGKPRAAELFATAIMLGTAADAVASALEAAAQSPRLRDPEALRAPVATLAAYRGEVARLVRTHQSKLASLGPGNPAALAQAREIRTAGVPRIYALAGDPDRAAAAVRDLQRVAARLAPATSALRSGFAALDDRGEMLAHGWAPGPGFHWRGATDVDAQPLLASLDAATRTAAALRPRATREASDAGRGKSIEGSSSAAVNGRIIDLTEAIDRRRAALNGPGEPPTPLTRSRCAASDSLPPSTRTVPPAGAPAIP